MGNRTLTSLEHVVALGGGHGLGRVMSCLNGLGIADIDRRGHHHG